MNGKEKTPESQEARENELVSLAYDRVKQRLQDGTARSQELVYLLKYGTEKERLEREKLRAETELAKTKIQAINDAAHYEEVVQKALDAFKQYQPSQE